MKKLYTLEITKIFLETYFQYIRDNSNNHGPGTIKREIRKYLILKNNEKSTNESIYKGTTYRIQILY